MSNAIPPETHSCFHCDPDKPPDKSYREFRERIARSTGDCTPFDDVSDDEYAFRWRIMCLTGEVLQ